MTTMPNAEFETFEADLTFETRNGVTTMIRTFPVGEDETGDDTYRYLPTRPSDLAKRCSTFIGEDGRRIATGVVIDKAGHGLSIAWPEELGDGTAERPVFTHPDDCGKFCTGEECTAVQFMCPRCGVHGFGDHCAETEDGAPVALCLNCSDWITGHFEV